MATDPPSGLSTMISPAGLDTAAKNGSCDKDGFTIVTRKHTQKKNNQDNAAAAAAAVGEKRSLQSLGAKQTETKRLCYDRELTVVVELEGGEDLSAMALIRAAKEVCGTVSACRLINKSTFELTVISAVAKEKLLDGFRVGETRIHARDISNDELVVSFMGLPVYIPDQDILDKLTAWGVTAVSPVRRRMWPGTDVADGTRFVKVRFTQAVQSLPYSARFMTAGGPEFFRVIHDRQVRVCRGCLQPGHVLRECPEFFCRRCGAQGHYARECTEPRALTCGTCSNPVPRCTCRGELGTEEDLEGGDEGEVVEEGAESQAEEEVDTVGKQNTPAQLQTINVNKNVDVAPGVTEESHTDATSLTSERGGGFLRGPSSKAPTGAAEPERRMGVESSSSPAPGQEGGVQSDASPRLGVGEGRTTSSSRQRSTSRRRREEIQAFESSLSSGLDRAGGELDPLRTPITRAGSRIPHPKAPVGIPTQPQTEINDDLMVVDTKELKRKNSAEKVESKIKYRK